MKTFTLSWLSTSTPLFCTLPLPMFSAEVGTSKIATPFAATVNGMLQPVSGMLTVPLVAAVETTCTFRLWAPKPFCMNPAQKRVPRVGSWVVL